MNSFLIVDNTTGSTLKINGTRYEIGISAAPIKIATIGINNNTLAAYCRASLSCFSPIFFPIKTLTPLPNPIKITHVNCEIVLVILNAAYENVLILAKIL